MLRQLLRKHKDKGITLYKETVQKLHDTDLTEQWEATDFARALVQTFTPPETDESAYRDLVNTLLTSALKAGCDKKPTNEDEEDEFCTEISPLVAIMEKVDPVRARKLKRLAPETVEESENPLRASYADLEEVAADGSIDDILALAEKHPDIDVSIYQTAIIKAYQAGDIERMKKIANSYPGEPAQREMLVDHVQRFVSMSEMTAEEVLEFNKHSFAQMGPRTNRAQILIGAATAIAATNKKVPLKLLDEALEAVEEIKAMSPKMETRLMVASLYCSQGSDRGLDVIQSQIPKLNELIDAAVKLDGLDTNYLRDGEWNMSANGEIGRLLTTMSESAGVFATCDFDRAVSMAGQFERNEIRIMAQVKLAQSVLITQPPRNKFYRPYTVQ